MEINIPLAIILCAALAWTKVSSTGSRHLGILACYASPPIFVFIIGIGNVATTWLAFSLFCALIRIPLEISRGAKGAIWVGSLLSVFFDWPVLVPETIECFLLPDSGFKA